MQAESVVLSELALFFFVKINVLSLLIPNNISIESFLSDFSYATNNLYCSGVNVCLSIKSH